MGYFADGPGIRRLQMRCRRAFLFTLYPVFMIVTYWAVTGIAAWMSCLVVIWRQWRAELPMLIVYSLLIFNLPQARPSIACLLARSPSPASVRAQKHCQTHVFERDPHTPLKNWPEPKTGPNQKVSHVGAAGAALRMPAGLDQLLPLRAAGHLLLHRHLRHLHHPGRVRPGSGLGARDWGLGVN